MSSEKDGRKGQQQRYPLGLHCLSAGLAACMADAVTHPLELVKIRMQVQGEKRGYKAKFLNTNSNKLSGPQYRGMLTAIYKIASEEGARALYNGLFASVQRQLCYASLRIGCYEPVKLFYLDLLSDGGERMISTLNVGIRILAASTVCCVAVAATQPMDVVKLRMQAMLTGPGVRARYSGTTNAYVTIAREEGLRGMWKGTLPNMARNSVCSASELVTYDIVKEALIRRTSLTDNLPCHLTSAFCSGFCAAVLTSPVDVVRTRIMNSSSNVYRGTLHCAYTMLKEEGPLAFYKGFSPLYWRIGSWNIVMFLCFEQLRKLSTYIS